MKQTILRRTALSSAILLSLSSAQGATILVGNGFSGCSLQDAITAANTDTAVNACTAGSGSDILQLSSANTSTTVSSISEASNAIGDVGLPIIDSVITIEGDGLTINADNSTENFRLFELAPGGDLTLRDTTVSGADDGIGLGSGLFSLYGRVTLDNSTFQNNNGALYLVYSTGQGHVITNSVISNNTISNPRYAAGIQTYGAELSLSNSSITNNRVVEDTSTIPLGGGPGGTPTGGGLTFYQSTVSMVNNTVSGNAGYFGGGLSVFGSEPPARFGDEGRFGVNRGAPILTDITLINNTITNNKAFIVGGLLDLAEAGSITMQGNILSGNTDFYSAYNNAYSAGYTTFSLDANNIIGDRGKTQTYGITLGPSDLTFADAATDNLYPLIRTNGQSVHPLKAGSAAIDGMPVSCFGLTTDQEGKGRGVDGDDNGTFVCDIGALENAKPIVVNDAPCDLVNAVNSANADASVGGCQPGNGHDIIVLQENSLHSLSSVEGSIGGVYNFGLPSVVTGITIEGNDSSIERSDSYAAPLGIALVNYQGDLTLSQTTLTNSNGFSAVLTQFGDTTLLDSIVTDNQSTAVTVIFGNKSAVLNSSITNNNNIGGTLEYAGAGIIASYSIGIKVENSTISGNTSGGSAGLNFLYNSQAELLNSTISGNTATTVGALDPESYGIGGGIVVNGSEVNMTGLTITNNSAEFIAGGLVVEESYGDSSVQLRQTIISGNSANIVPPSPVAVVSGERRSRNSLLYPNGRPNTQRADVADLRGILVDEAAITGSPASITVDASNIFGQNNNAETAGFMPGPSDVIPAGPTSAVIEVTLADNGGNTLTHNPVLNGVAVDNAGACESNVDQVGNIRNWDSVNNAEQFGACDIGAVELGSIPVDDIIFKDGFDSGFITR